MSGLVYAVSALHVSTRTGRFAVIAATVLALGILFAGVAGAQSAQVYFSYSPEDVGPTSGGTIGLPPGATNVPLHLWIAGGGSASPAGACQLTATGNEICGFDIALDTSGHYTFEDDSPNQNTVIPSTKPTIHNVS